MQTIIQAKIKFASTMAKVCTFITLVPLFFVPLTEISFLKIFYMCLTSVKTFFLSINLPKIIMFSLNFTHLFLCVKDLFSGVTLLSSKIKNGLYPLHSLQWLIKPTALLGEHVSVEQWHSRLGHPALRIVRQVLSSHKLPITTNKTLPVCHACQLGKSHRFPFSSSSSRSSFP